MVLARSGVLVVGMGRTFLSMGSGGVDIRGLGMGVLAAKFVPVGESLGECGHAERELEPDEERGGCG